jgi:hypothetical protein
MEMLVITFVFSCYAFLLECTQIQESELFIISSIIRAGIA